MSKKSTITVCSSASFYRKVNEIAEQLENIGFDVIVPKNALVMKQSGDYDVSHYKTWFGDANDYPKKAALMRTHFDEVARGDICLVVNEEKHGQPNYIGGNVLMEMAIAFYLKKPIYLLNDIPSDSKFEEEIKGMMPGALHGDLKGIKI